MTDAREYLGEFLSDAPIVFGKCSPRNTAKNSAFQ
jgi:hypothetical protein